MTTRLPRLKSVSVRRMRSQGSQHAQNIHLCRQVHYCCRVCHTICKCANVTRRHFLTNIWTSRRSRSTQPSRPSAPCCWSRGVEEEVWLNGIPVSISLAPRLTPARGHKPEGGRHRDRVEIDTPAHIYTTHATRNLCTIRRRQLLILSSLKLCQARKNTWLIMCLAVTAHTLNLFGPCLA